MGKEINKSLFLNLQLHDEIFNEQKTTLLLLGINFLLIALHLYFHFMGFSHKILISIPFTNFSDSKRWNVKFEMRSSSEKHSMSDNFSISTKLLLNLKVQDEGKAWRRRQGKHCHSSKWHNLKMLHSKINHFRKVREMVKRFCLMFY